jgi:hypothetical protein
LHRILFDEQDRDLGLTFVSSDDDPGDAGVPGVVQLPQADKDLRSTSRIGDEAPPMSPRAISTSISSSLSSTLIEYPPSKISCKGKRISIGLILT